MTTHEHTCPKKTCKKVWSCENKACTAETSISKKFKIADALCKQCLKQEIDKLEPENVRTVVASPGGIEYNPYMYGRKSSFEWCRPYR